MAEANPDPSGSTGEFRAFVEGGHAEHRPGALRSPGLLAAAALVVVIAVLIVALAVR